MLTEGNNLGIKGGSTVQALFSLVLHILHLFALYHASNMQIFAETREKIRESTRIAMRSETVIVK